MLKYNIDIKSLETYMVHLVFVRNIFEFLIPLIMTQEVLKTLNSRVNKTKLECYNTYLPNLYKLVATSVSASSRYMHARRKEKVFP